MLKIFNIFILWYILITALTKSQDDSNTREAETPQLGQRLVNKGAELANWREWNFMAFVKVKHKTAKRACAGTILSEYLILIAAHCLVGSAKTRKVEVYVGNKNYKLGTFYESKKQYVYPGYDSNISPYGVDNLAIVRVLKKIKLSSDVRLVTLSKQYINPFTRCKIAGWWGANRVADTPAKVKTSTESPYILRDFEVLVGTHENCKNEEQSEIAEAMWIESSMNTTMFGPYLGEFGSPLVCNQRQVGAATGKFNRHSPSDVCLLYVRIPYYISWIKQMIEKYSKAPSPVVTKNITISGKQAEETDGSHHMKMSPVFSFVFYFLCHYFLQ